MTEAEKGNVEKVEQKSYAIIGDLVQDIRTRKDRRATEELLVECLPVMKDGRDLEQKFDSALKKYVGETGFTKAEKYLTTLKLRVPGYDGKTLVEYEPEAEGLTSKEYLWGTIALLKLRLLALKEQKRKEEDFMHAVLLVVLLLLHLFSRKKGKTK